MYIEQYSEKLWQEKLLVTHPKSKFQNRAQEVDAIHQWKHEKNIAD